MALEALRTVRCLALVLFPMVVSDGIRCSALKKTENNKKRLCRYKGKAYGKALINSVLFTGRSRGNERAVLLCIDSFSEKARGRKIWIYYGRKFVSDILC